MRRPAPAPPRAEMKQAAFKETLLATNEETNDVAAQGASARGGAGISGGGGSASKASNPASENPKESSDEALVRRNIGSIGSESAATLAIGQQTAANSQANQSAQVAAAQQREQEHEKNQSARKLDENKESTRSNNQKQEFEQARKFHQQQQQRQRAGSAPQEPKGQQAQRYRQVQKSEEVKEQLEGASEDHSQVACARCGFLLGGSADVNCPICSADHADKIHQMLTQYRLSSDSWVSAVDTVVASPRAQLALPEASQAAVELRYIPKIPKFAQLLRTVKE